MVAPSRGRGSKHDHHASRSRSVPVAPSRGRGSKRLRRVRGRAGAGSPLHGGVDRNLSGGRRPTLNPTGRPFTGAWIETSGPSMPPRGRSVAPSRGRGSKHLARVALGLRPAGRPFTGAWIETPMRRSSTRAAPTVAPSRGRGSKHCRGQCRDMEAAVAPSRGRGSKQAKGEMTSILTWSPLHGGVDRNILPGSPWASVQRVAPSRGRGSKRLPARALRRRRRVAPSRGRGSKPSTARSAAWRCPGRPFTGAWIETAPPPKAASAATKVAPSRGRGSKQRNAAPYWAAFPVAPSRGRGSKLHGRADQPAVQAVAPSRGRGSKPVLEHGRRRMGGSPLHGGVDRNRCATASAAPSWWSPLHGGVDRNKRYVLDRDEPFMVAPSRGRGSKLERYQPDADQRRGRPFTGAWIETS